MSANNGVTFDFKDVFTFVPHIMRGRLPVLLRGRHGIGKSEVVYQLAAIAGKTLGLKTEGLPVVERRASQMTEGDLLGLPDISSGATKWNPPDWLMQACNNPVVLFLDEIDRAVPEVRQGIFQLTDSRAIAGYKLHPDTLIFGAINGGRHSAQYQVGEMDPAELSRWAPIDVEPTIEDFLLWGGTNNNIDGFIINFISHNKMHLEHGGGEFEPNKIYPTRRSWKRLNDVLVKGNLLKDPKKTSTSIFMLATAFVGHEAAISLREFADKYQSVVTVEDLINDAKFANTKGWKITDWNKWVEMFAAHDLRKQVLTPDQVKNSIKAFVTMQPEVAMKFYVSIADLSENALAFATGKTEDGKDVRMIMAEYAVGEMAKKEEEEKKAKKKA